MAKVRKQFILENSLIKKAQKILGTSTETETIKKALTDVVARKEIWDAHRKLSGRLKIENMDQSTFDE